MSTEPGSSAATQPQPQVPLQPRFLERYGLTVANGVTAVRAVLVPFIIVALIDHNYREAFWLTVIAGASDAIDGVIARTFSQSWLGAYLDPLADKLLITGLFVTLAIQGELPLWLVVLALARDVAIVATVVTFRRLKGVPLRMRPLFSSRVNTFVQVALIIATLADLAGVVHLAAERQYLVLLAAATTVVSWIAYFIEGLRALRERQPAA
jgi:cardiolipin synthase